MSRASSRAMSQVLPLSEYSSLAHSGLPAAFTLAGAACSSFSSFGSHLLM